ncbi:MAG: PEP-CTERM/exosortase system-associated acyltransferase [Rhodoferax sp.]|uniref:PEP-CTERM/exosortase system-associated acyltransferase n=1 Tax=Rhodoferax sp. TaxID=50421 RepID=UPI0014012C55|nr:PEP-CTERM/exosortase system-associated acyltransferase [Rhodoferax sp.]NDP37839.1 PEP-CTERM/exosortase system-associated acyltransferase [Rhodoferax sp.]
MPTLSLDQAEFAPLFHSCEAIQSRDNALMLRIFELRYQVYCEERGFLPAANYPERCETDERDASSAHFCAFNLRDELVGYVRLVRSDLGQSFPFQSHCSALLEGASLAPPAQAAEISRLMVRRDYRRRRGDVLEGVTVEEDLARGAHELRDHSPQILLSMYRQMYAFSLANGIRYWYAAMERPLARALNQMNFVFRQIGPPSDYYGVVAPYIGDLRELEAHLEEKNPALMAWMQRSETVSL